MKENIRLIISCLIAAWISFNNLNGFAQAAFSLADPVRQSYNYYGPAPKVIQDTKRLYQKVPSISETNELADTHDRSFMIVEPDLVMETDVTRVVKEPLLLGNMPVVVRETDTFLQPASTYSLNTKDPPTEDIMREELYALPSRNPIHFRRKGYRASRKGILQNSYTDKRHLQPS